MSFVQVAPQELDFVWRTTIMDIIALHERTEELKVEGLLNLELRFREDHSGVARRRIAKEIPELQLSYISGR